MRKRAWLLSLIVFGSVLSAHAQEEPGWTFSGRFQGSSSSSGVVLKADPSLGYVFGPHFETYAGLPVYFVRDNGAGFDKADADMLFAPFQRLPGAEEFRGFGIGLTTVERIIRRHGGKIRAEGEPDKGATFWFTLSDDRGSNQVTM